MPITPGPGLWTTSAFDPHPSAWRSLGFLLSSRSAVAGRRNDVLDGVLAGVLGGGQFSRTLAALAVLAAPTVFGITNFYSMNAFDLVFWLVAILLWPASVVRKPRRSLGSGLLGVVLGLSLLNKLSVGALGVGIAAALVLTPLRLTSNAIARLAAGVAFVLRPMRSSGSCKMTGRRSSS